MGRWSVIAPIRYLDRAGLFKSDTPLGPGVRIIPLPAFLGETAIHEEIGKKSTAWVKACDYAIAVEFDAASPKESDPDWSGKTPQNKEARATELVYLSYFALWLAKPTELAFHVLFLAHHHNDRWEYVWHNEFRLMSPNAEDAKANLTHPDLELAGQILKALISIKRGSAVWVAVRSILEAHQQDWWDGRYLYNWIGLEALFGPENPTEITYRLSLRASYFISREPDQRKALFSTIRELYGLRSRVVHGFRISNPVPEDQKAALDETERIIRQALLRIFTEPAMANNFVGKKREEFLENLVFSVRPLDAGSHPRRDSA